MRLSFLMTYNLRCREQPLLSALCYKTVAGVLWVRYSFLHSRDKALVTSIKLFRIYCRRQRLGGDEGGLALKGNSVVEFPKLCL